MARHHQQRNTSPDHAPAKNKIMKFVAHSAVLAMMVAAATLSSVDAIKGSASARREDNRTRRLKKGDKKGKGGDFAACPTCGERLPGYAFFGQNYLDPDFWSYEEPDDILDGEDPVPIEDFLLVGNIIGAGPLTTCYRNDNTFGICRTIALLAELIYESDLLRCLLMSLTTTVRDLVCLADSDRRRKLNEDGEPLTLSNEDLVIEMAGMNGWNHLSDIFKSFGLENNEQVQDFLSQNLEVRKRKMEVEDIRGKGDTADDLFADAVGGGVDEFYEFFGYGNPDIETAIRANSFVAKCQDAGPPLDVCAGLFGLLKVIDASVCHYRETLECGADTCTKDLTFDIAYNTEMLAIDLPFPPSGAAVVADILSPCSACLLEKSDGCSPFCPFYSSFHVCPEIPPENALAALADPGAIFDGIDIGPDGDVILFFTAIALLFPLIIFDA